jgi:hypothetical protein
MLLFAVLLLVVQPVHGADRVFVFRHCARAPNPHVYGNNPNLTSPGNYSNTTWPAFPAEAMQCTPRGLRIIQNTGARLHKLGLVPPDGPIQMFADAFAERDNDTAWALAAGLGVGDVVINDGSIFDPVRAGYCKPLAGAVRAAATRDAVGRVPPPAGYNDTLRWLQNDILGHGVAESIENIPDQVSSDNGYWYGRAGLASAFAETFRLQEGAGIDCAWGRLGEQSGLKSSLYSRLLPVHFYYRHVTSRSPILVKHTSSNLLKHVVDALDSPSSGTIFFVGHDTSLDALATLLNMTWNPSGGATPPGGLNYPQDATPPGSALVFEKDQRAVTTTSPVVIKASFLSTTFETEMDDITVRPAVFKAAASPSMTLDQFVKDANAVIDPTCLPPDRHEDPAISHDDQGRFGSKIN